MRMGINVGEAEAAQPSPAQAPVELQIRPALSDIVILPRKVSSIYPFALFSHRSGYGGFEDSPSQPGMHSTLLS